MVQKRLYNLAYYQKKASDSEDQNPSKRMKTVGPTNESENGKVMQEPLTESRKRKPNVAAVIQLQALAFEERKKAIHTCSITEGDVVAAVLEKFPFLDKEIMVSELLL